MPWKILPAAPTVGSDVGLAGGRAKRKRLREWVYTFQPRFVSRVRDGRKLRTMRPKRKDGKRPVAGEGISLRRWSGLPYRSFQEVIRRSKVKAVSDVVIEQGEYPLVAGKRLTPAEAQDFARYDGFENYADMLEWFDHAHGHRIELDMIEWEPEPANITLLPQTGRDKTP